MSVELEKLSQQAGALQSETNRLAVALSGALAGVEKGGKEA
ncbi:MAG: hypothetical protein U1F77_13345 [Kiritimatiellia bacterium]